MHKLAMRVGWAHALVLASCLCYAEALCVSLPLHHARLPLPGCRLSALPLRSQRRLRAPAAQMLADAAGEKQAAASNGDGAFAGLAEQIGRALGEDEHGGAGAAAAGARAGGERGEADASANAQDSGWMAKWSDVATGIVLIVGDGNLSFSLALVRAFPKMRLIATTFDSGRFICVHPAGEPQWSVCLVRGTPHNAQYLRDCIHLPTTEQFVRDKYGAGDVIAELKEKGAEVVSQYLSHAPTSVSLSPPSIILNMRVCACAVRPATYAYIFPTVRRSFPTQKRSHARMCARTYARTYARAHTRIRCTTGWMQRHWTLHYSRAWHRWWPLTVSCLTFRTTLAKVCINVCVCVSLSLFCVSLRLCARVTRARVVRAPKSRA